VQGVCQKRKEKYEIGKSGLGARYILFASGKGTKQRRCAGDANAEKSGMRPKRSMEPLTPIDPGERSPLHVLLYGRFPTIEDKLPVIEGAASGSENFRSSSCNSKA